MNYKINILIIPLVFLLMGCKDWDEHYETQPVTSNENVWDALQKEPSVSLFVSYLKERQFDTLFQTNNTYTIFAPVKRGL